MVHAAKVPCMTGITPFPRYGLGALSSKSTEQPARAALMAAHRAAFPPPRITTSTDTASPPQRHRPGYKGTQAFSKLSESNKSGHVLISALTPPVSVDVSLGKTDLSQWRIVPFSSDTRQPQSIETPLRLFHRKTAGQADAS